MDLVKPAKVPQKFWDAAVNAYQKTGVDPYLISAIGQIETQWGTNKNSYPGFSMGYGDYSPGPSGKIWKYGDTPGEFTVQTYSAAKQIGGYMGSKPLTQQNLTDFSINSWKAGSNNADRVRWANNVWSAYTGLTSTKGGATVDPSITPSAGPTGSSAAPTTLTSTGGSFGGGVFYFLILFFIAGIAIVAFVKIFSGSKKESVNA
ncbi:MAG: hypothetical protein Q8904_15075 [Bacteroidota bacterium]|nr:hypothetical protein [Bacteroidota bacterium]